MERFARSLVILSTGLLAGTFAYAFFAMVPTFSEVPLEVHLTYRTALMRHNGLYVQMVMGMSILSTIWWAYIVRDSRYARFLATASALLALTSLVVTRFGNVPINQLIKTWPPAAPPAGYQELLARWMTFHNIRTGAAVMCFVLIVIAQAISTSAGRPKVADPIPVAR